MTLFAGQPLRQFRAQARARFQQRLKADRIRSHADEGVSVVIGDVFIVAEQDLMSRPVVTSQLGDEALHHRVGQTAGGEHLPRIEQIAGMLPVHRGHKFAAVEFGRGEHG